MKLIIMDYTCSCTGIYEINASHIRLETIFIEWKKVAYNKFQAIPLKFFRGTTSQPELLSYIKASHDQRLKAMYTISPHCGEA